MPSRTYTGLPKKLFLHTSTWSLLSFLEILDCPNVQELHCGANVTYGTDVVANELQDSVAQVIGEDTDKEAEQSSCISILADKSTDISVTQMLVV